VLAWGEGREGQLGSGKAHARWDTPRVIPGLAGKQVASVSCGSAHSAAVTCSGEVYTWGRGFEGQLGHGSSKTQQDDPACQANGVQLTPRLVTHFLPAKKPKIAAAAIACGNNFTLVLGKGGEVWAFGEGGCGQLGSGRRTQSARPLLALAASPETGGAMVAVAAGWAHALALSERGQVYAWGLNHVGQLGVGDTKARHTPTRTVFSASAEVAEIHALGGRSCALTRGGNVYAWGAVSSGGSSSSSSNAHPATDVTAAVTTPHLVQALAG
ncbi:regulator of chromosome condensation 1/beta-lactamase-inhibitor protein II, partial [Tribonema minus]